MFVVVGFDLAAGQPLCAAMNAECVRANENQATLAVWRSHGLVGYIGSGSWKPVQECSLFHAIMQYKSPSRAAR